MVHEADVVEELDVVEEVDMNVVEEEVEEEEVDQEEVDVEGRKRHIMLDVGTGGGAVKRESLFFKL